MMELIVSLPGNDRDLALSAKRGGANAVKVHMNVSHRASGLSFGVFADEAPNVRRIIAESGLKVGLMPGQECLPSADEIQSLIDDGLNFIDIYAHHMPTSYLPLGLSARLIPAVDHTYGAFETSSLSRLTSEGKAAISMLEASIVPPDFYGSRLNSRDLAVYAAIVKASLVPILIPTQKFIVPEDVVALSDIGVGALMIGVIVTGPTPGGIEKVTASFRNAIDRLSA
jgi:hypothetical protein